MTVGLNGYRMYKFEEVERSTYLGTVFTRKPEINEEVRSTILAGNRCIAALKM